jgi:hypothetical protein
MPRLYRYDGFESVGSIANATTSGTIINAPGAGFSIYLLGASAFSTQRFQETNVGGSTIIQMNSGIADFPATIKVRENTAVYSVSSQPCSLFYYIDNA